jgi:ferredoxin
MQVAISKVPGPTCAKQSVCRVAAGLSCPGALTKVEPQFRPETPGILSPGEWEDEMSRKVYLVEEECIGCGSCVEICPGVFLLDEATEKAHVIVPEGGDEACIEEAITTCPVECIHWEE